MKQIIKQISNMSLQKSLFTHRAAPISAEYLARSLADLRSWWPPKRQDDESIPIPAHRPAKTVSKVWPITMGLLVHDKIYSMNNQEPVNTSRLGAITKMSE